MQEIFKTTLNFILPARCPVTGEIVDGVGMLSPEAWVQLNFITEPYCSKCGIPFDFHYDVGEGGDKVCESCKKKSPTYSTARSVFVYDDHSRDLILGFKHGDQTFIAPAFVPWLKRTGKDMVACADLIIPVPLHRWRLLKRRYNQAAILAQYLSKEVSIPTLVEGLVRRRSTPSQGYLNFKDRMKNVNDAFVVPEKYQSLLREKNIILIDDVYTSGATVNECTNTLMEAGASRVDVLTLARAIKH